MSTICLFNFFDTAKNYKQFIEFEKDANIKSFKKTTLILVFDAMAGINTYESKGIHGERFLRISDKFFKNLIFMYMITHELLAHRQQLLLLI